MQEQKVERERKCIERLAAQAAQKAAREEAKQDKQVEKQLLLEAIQVKKRPSDKKQQASQSKAAISVVRAIEELKELESRQTRIGRKIRLPQHLQGHEL